jgi:hypothetical protein
MREDNRIDLVAFLAILGALALLAALYLPTPAECQTCLPTFCGFDADCPGDCSCYVPNGQATGECY